LQRVASLLSTGLGGTARLHSANALTLVASFGSLVVSAVRKPQNGVMRNLFAITLVFFLGLFSGWWLRDASSETPTTATQGVPHLSPTVASRFEDMLPPQIAAAGQQSLQPAFRTLLSEGRFEEAITQYESRDQAGRDRLHPELESFARRCLSECNPARFLDLAQFWLAAFYDDIDILLLLAEHQRREGSPEMAADTLLTARTYALAGPDREAVKHALGRLTQETDTSYTAQDNWIELMGYYEYLQALDLSTPASELRQADLYAALGETARAQRLLNALLDQDIGADPVWTAQLRERLAEEPATLQSPSAALSNGLPLSRQRSHYLVDSQLNGEQLVLMIDTGASITSISSKRFLGLPRQHFQLMGSRMFNTASGYTLGDVYRAQTFTLGKYTLENIAIAVLPFQSPEDADGLLGMNVLRNFRFEIDQDNSMLRLEPRQAVHDE
jgi:clan AA aspartic protease (TIGR02281 family)